MQYTGQVAKLKGRQVLASQHRPSQLESQLQGISDRMMTTRFPLSDNAYATLVSVYAHTMTNQDEHKDAFYQELNKVIRSVPAGDRLIIMWDFRARIGSNHTAWAYIIGHHISV